MLRTAFYNVRRQSAVHAGVASSPSEAALYVIADHGDGPRAGWHRAATGQVSPKDKSWQTIPGQGMLSGRYRPQPPSRLQARVLTSFLAAAPALLGLARKAAVRGSSPGSDSSTSPSTLILPSWTGPTCVSRSVGFGLAGRATLYSDHTWDTSGRFQPNISVFQLTEVMSLTDASPTVAAKAAKAASHILATLTVEARNDALTLMHDALAESKDVVLAANSEDVELARKEVAAGRLGSALVDRLDLNRKGKWDDMLTGILNVRALPDPLGIITVRTRLDDGLDLERISCPIGVLLVIFEARPEVLANIAALAVKSGNAALLKGGKESTRTMVAMAAALTKALAKSVVPAAAVQLVTGRESVTELLALDRDIDLVVPRGSNELVRSIKAGTRIPVLGHADGLCSIYVDAGLRTQHDAEMVTNVLVDAKTGYPAACNSMETLLVHEDALQEPAFRTAVAGLLGAGVTLHCDPTTREVVKEIVAGLGEQKDKQVRVATAADFDTEFLSLDLAVKVVPSLEAAVVHINEHGSHHTDAILTASREHAEHFMAAVDSAGVYWNASTRFADGMRYGFGTEVGISTNKIHSRGPVGLEGLTIYKYKLRGTGQTASEYGKGLKLFKHEPLPLL